MPSASLPASNCIAETWLQSGVHQSFSDVVGDLARTRLPGVVAVRDAKDPDGPKLIFEPAQWAAFTGSIKAGAFRLK